jgi:hypothetical protein
LTAIANPARFVFAEFLFSGVLENFRWFLRRQNPATHLRGIKTIANRRANN